jgi:hypothetical protein
MKLLITLGFTAFSVLTLNAQSGQVETMSQNNVSTFIGNNGLFFKHPTGTGPAYEIPKGSGKSTVSSTGLWLGGVDANGQLKLAAMTYGAGDDFYAGPHSTIDAYSDSLYISKYGTGMWTITRSDVEYHQSNFNSPGYSMPSTILNWPGNGDTTFGVAPILAPFVDLNGNDVYEPNLGDYPMIKGDYAKYVILNDSKDFHYESGGDPIGAEVHLMFYQIQSNDYRNETTYLNTKVFNRGGETLYNFKIGFYMDPDLGNYADDFVGCDSTRNMAFVYNADAIDESNGGAIGYGENPPAFGIVALSNPMVGFVSYNSLNTPPHSDPTLPSQFYNYMSGLWQDASNMVYGGQGFTGSSGASNIPTRFQYSGNPADSASWTERTAGGNGNTPGDRRLLMIMNQQDFNVDSHLCNDYAFIFGRNGDYENNIQYLYSLATLAKLDFDTDWRNGCALTTAGVVKGQSFDFSIYPNPSTGVVNLNLGELSSAMIEVSTINGKLIYSQSTNGQSSIHFQLDTPPGIYLVKVIFNGNEHTEKLIIR